MYKDNTPTPGPESLGNPLTQNSEPPTIGSTPQVRKKHPLKIWVRACIWLFIAFATAVLTFAIPLHHKILGDYCAQRDYGFPVTVYVSEYQYNSTPAGVDRVPVGKRVGNTNMFFENIGGMIAECGWGNNYPPNFFKFALNTLIFFVVFFAVDVLARHTRRYAYFLSPLFVFICWLFA